MKPDNTKPYESRLDEDLDKFLLEVKNYAKEEWNKRHDDVQVFVTCTHRNNARQTQLFNQGRNGNKGPIATWAKAGQSKHNFYPSKAYDIAFMNNATKKLDWSQKLFVEYWEIIFAKYGDKVRWGGDFDLNRKIDKKIDLPHFEIA